VKITADSGYDLFFPAITGKTSSGDFDMMHAIVCKFGEFGIVPAKFVSKTEIATISPDTGMSRDDISEEKVALEIALNGQDFYRAGDFTFKGNGTGIWVILMWLGTIICLVVIILLLIVCCYYLWNQISKAPEEAPPQAELGFDPYIDGRPHVFRDPHGVIRPEGSPGAIGGYESYTPQAYVGPSG
jgi:hypothetical protein